MTAADWGLLVPVIIALLTAGTAWLKAHLATNTANRANVNASMAKMNASSAVFTASTVQRAFNAHCAPDEVKPVNPDTNN
jgi:hypothetical protein